jgi:hypothetical protein
MMTDDVRREPDDGGASGASSSRGARLPRANLANVVELLEKAYEHGRSPSITQVAAAADQPLNSGAFRSRMAAAAHFGLLDPTRGRVQITDLGMRTLDVEQRPAALVEAWMQVPVFKALFDRYDGNRLPPPGGIEAELRNLGVPSNNVVAIRRVLMSSAETAGLLNAARDRLVKPTLDLPTARIEDGGGSSSISHGSSDTRPILLDFGVAGQVVISVDIDWLALKRPIFDDLRGTIEKLEELAASQRKPNSESPENASADLPK